MIDDADDQQREAHLTSAEKSSAHGLYDRARTVNFLMQSNLDPSKRY